MSSSRQADPLAGLYAFVEEQCTLEQVQNLLRQAKELDNAVRISETNKTKVVQTNLRLAVDGRRVAIEAVQNLIRDAEENGAQHVFLYALRDGVAANYAAGDVVGRRLFGSKWPNKTGFPLYLALPETEEWVDFRTIADGGWIAKAYGRQTITERVGAQEVDRIEDGIEFLIQRLKRRTVRTTFLARFLPRLGMLELRIPLTSSRRTLEELHERFVEMLKPALKFAKDFDPWDLGKARIKFLKNYDPKNGIYRIKDTRFQNSKNDTASFSCHDDEDEGDLFADVRTKQAIDAILDGSPACQHLAFWFLKTDATDALKEDLRVSMGSFASNELMIGAHTTPAAVDYVLNRIRDKS
jgi:hypothetical protein